MKIFKDIATTRQFIDLAMRYGKLVAQDLNRTFVKEIRPRASDNTFSLSGRFGFSEFPFHTDGAHLTSPPKMVLLRYLTTSSITYTDVMSPYLDQIESLIERQMDYLFYVNGGKGKFYSSFITRINMNFRLRYDPICMKLKLGTKDGLKEFFSALKNKSKRERVFPEKNKTVLINNWEEIHMRSSVPTVEQGIRQLQRIWIN